MKYLPLNPDIFVQNRKRFIAKKTKPIGMGFNDISFGFRVLSRRKAW